MHEDLECISYFPKGLCRKAGLNTEWLYHVFSTKENLASYRLWDDTLVIFITVRSGGFNWPLRGTKYTVSEEGAGGAAFIWKLFAYEK